MTASMNASLSPPSGSSAGRPSRTAAPEWRSAVPAAASSDAGDRQQVVALVAVRRERHRLAEPLEVAQPDADREDVDLPAGVVDVELAVDGVSGGEQQVAERGAVGGVPAVADVQRPGRVRRHELEQDPLAAAGRAPAVGVALVEGRAELGVVGGRREVEVDEAGTGDLDLA